MPNLKKTKTKNTRLVFFSMGVIIQMNVFSKGVYVPLKNKNIHLTEAVQSGFLSGGEEAGRRDAALCGSHAGYPPGPCWPKPDGLVFVGYSCFT